MTVDAKSKRKIWVLRILGGWTVFLLSALFLLNISNRVGRALFGMAIATAVVWIGGCGTLMWRCRDRIRTWVRARKGPWWIKFILGCTLLALVEEAITTAMTNAAPQFGVEVGEAYITASTNYLDVVLHHSVVVFIPMFIAWAVMLRWWQFGPFSVFLLFGLTGILAETSFAGPLAILNFGFWIFVYGLMVWLPAYCLPEKIGRRPAPWWAYPIAVVLPIACVPIDFILAPWLWLIPWLNGSPHPNLHFPPIGQ